MTPFNSPLMASGWRCRPAACPSRSDRRHSAYLNPYGYRSDGGVILGIAFTLAAATTSERSHAASCRRIGRASERFEWRVAAEHADAAPPRRWLPGRPTV